MVLIEEQNRSSLEIDPHRADWHQSLQHLVGLHDEVSQTVGNRIDDEAVQAAKDKPEGVKPPEEYRKK